jgi:hypothetical protein
MSQVRLCPQLIEMIESFGKESRLDPGFTLHSQTGEGQHDQIEASVSNDGEIGVNDRRQIAAIDEKISWMKIPVDQIAANEVFGSQRAPEQFDSLDQGLSPSVVPMEGFVSAVSSPTDGERRDQVFGPAADVAWICQSEPAWVKIQELIDKSMIDCGRRSPRHELLKYEADILGIDDRFGRDWPGRLTSKALGEDDGFASNSTAVRRTVPLHNDQSTIRSEELVRSGFAAAELTQVAERLPGQL